MFWWESIPTSPMKFVHFENFLWKLSTNNNATVQYNFPFKDSKDDPERISKYKRQMRSSTPATPKLELFVVVVNAYVKEFKF